MTNLGSGALALTIQARKAPGQAWKSWKLLISSVNRSAGCCQLFAKVRSSVSSGPMGESGRMGIPGSMLQAGAGLLLALALAGCASDGDPPAGGARFYNTPAARGERQRRRPH